MRLLDILACNSANGKHLMQCEEYRCDNKYYKCPGYYCIPWKNVCNQVWDCPRGTEEIGCSERKSCPGQFKCNNSMICVTLHSLCDNETDCLYGDDELFCKNVPECPESCRCLLFLPCAVGELNAFYKISF